jgi:hypothetical protein
MAETIDRQLPLRRITKKFSSLAEAPAEMLGLLFGGCRRMEREESSHRCMDYLADSGNGSLPLRVF